MIGFPQNNFNTINYPIQMNKNYDQFFPNNTIDNNLFSFNNENKVSFEKKKSKKQEDNDGSFKIILEEVKKFKLNIRLLLEKIIGQQS